MNLDVRLDGRSSPLRLDRDGEAWVANGRAASVLEVEPGIYSVLLDGRSFEARVERGDDAWIVHLRGRRFVVAVRDPRRLGRASGAPHREGRQTIASPMPGKVVRLLVASGDTVEAGQGLLVVEAMKMQNEMKAPKSGRVVTLSAREGDTVAAGDVLAVIE